MVLMEENPKNLPNKKFSKEEYMDYAAEQIARLFYQHYQYLRQQEKKEQFNDQKPNV
jgi:hypothetical protein